MKVNEEGLEPRDEPMADAAGAALEGLNEVQDKYRSLARRAREGVKQMQGLLVALVEFDREIDFWRRSSGYFRDIDDLFVCDGYGDEVAAEYEIDDSILDEANLATASGRMALAACLAKVLDSISGVVSAGDKREAEAAFERIRSHLAKVAEMGFDNEA